MGRRISEIRGPSEVNSRSDFRDSGSGGCPKMMHCLPGLRSGLPVPAATELPGDLTAFLAGDAAELNGTTLSAETCRTYISRPAVPGLARRHSPAAPRRSGPSRLTQGLKLPWTRWHALAAALRDPLTVVSPAPTPRSLPSTTSTGTLRSLGRGGDRPGPSVEAGTPRTGGEGPHPLAARGPTGHLTLLLVDIALIPYYPGARISEACAWTPVTCAWLEPAKASAQSGQGRQICETPIHVKLSARAGAKRPTERAAWPGAGTSPALFLHTKGGRLSAGRLAASSPPSPGRLRSMHDPTAHVLGYTFATKSCAARQGLGLLLLTGHSRLDTTLAEEVAHRTGQI